MSITNDYGTRSLELSVCLRSVQVTSEHETDNLKTRKHTSHEG
jgi:hypothetical protein